MSYSSYINYLVNRLRFKEARIYLRRLAELPLQNNPEMLFRRTLTEAYVTNCGTFLGNEKDHRVIGRASFRQLKPLFPMIETVSPLLQSQMLGDLSLSLKLQGRFGDALAVNAHAIEKAQSLVERERAQRLNERLKILHASGRYAEVISAIPDTLPVNLFYRTSFMMWQGYAFLDLKEKEEGIRVLTVANTISIKHEMLSMAKLIQNRLHSL